MPEKLRLRFEKTGRAIYISHLDLMRTMQRVFLRADCPLKYSRALTPTRSFPSCCRCPSAWGACVSSWIFNCVRTWISLRFPSGSRRSCRGHPARSRHIRPDARCASSKWLRVTGRYEYDRAEPAEMAQKLSAFYARDAIVITRKTKRGEGQMDIVPAIAELHIRPEDTCVTVEAVVSAQEPTLNPDHLVAALQQLAPELAPDFAAFTRQEVYTEDMQIFR